MRHRKKGKTLSRTSPQRKRLLRSMTIALLKHGSVRATPSRANAVRRMVEPIITHAKVASDAPKSEHVRVRRYAAKQLGTKEVLSLVMERAQKYRMRKGGYTRITKLAQRREGDAANMVVLEFVE